MNYLVQWGDAGYVDFEEYDTYDEAMARAGQIDGAWVVTVDDSEAGL